MVVDIEDYYRAVLTTDWETVEMGREYRYTGEMVEKVPLAIPSIR